MLIGIFIRILGEKIYINKAILTRNFGYNWWDYGCLRKKLDFTTGFGNSGKWEWGN